MINNSGDLDDIDPEIQGGRIASTVGDKKREMIVKKADEMKIKIFNRRDL